ncbi:MAG: NAD-dependent epimerase/dehydratase family protein [Pseudomonadota bacterium]
MTLNSHNLSKERVLIVGCGDIGARFSNMAPDRYLITGLRRHPPVDTEHLHYQVCDVNDTDALASILNQTAFSIILITMTPSESTDSGYERAYVQTCRNVVAGLKKNHHKPRLLLFVSSTGVYGQNHGEWVDENSSTEPESFSGKRLLEAEKVILASGFVSTVIRFSGIYGPGRNRLIDQVLEGRAKLSSQITNRIHVDDCAAALLHLVELDREGAQLDSIYIATDSAPVTMSEVITWLAQQLGKSLSVTANEIEAGNSHDKARSGDKEGNNSDGGSNTKKNNNNKACDNQRLLATGFQLRYPGYQQGYAAILADKPQ